jgi:hypothetical protein
MILVVLIGRAVVDRLLPHLWWENSSKPTFGSRGDTAHREDWNGGHPKSRKLVDGWREITVDQGPIKRPFIRSIAEGTNFPNFRQGTVSEDNSPLVRHTLKKFNGDTNLRKGFSFHFLTVQPESIHKSTIQLGIFGGGGVGKTAISLRVLRHGFDRTYRLTVA